MMGRPRSFDWDEACALRAQGLFYTEIAARLGVSANAVASACDPAYRRRQYAKNRMLIEEKRHPCFGGCGRLVYDHYAEARSGYCLHCSNANRRVVRHGTEHEYVYGCRCPLCTAAMTEARRRRRHATRVPCSHGCGTLVDAVSSRYPGKPPECYPCAMRRIHAERKQAAA